MTDPISIYPHPLVFKMPQGPVTYFFDPDALVMTPAQLENFQLMINACETNPIMVEVVNGILSQMLGT